MALQKTGRGYPLCVNCVKDYLYFRIQGETVTGINFGLYEQIITACKELDCRKVLIASSLVPYKSLLALQEVAILIKLKRQPLEKLAWVENVQTSQAIKIYFEETAQNCQKTMKYFEGVQEAEQWLVAQ